MQCARNAAAKSWVPVRGGGGGTPAHANAADVGSCVRACWARGCGVRACVRAVRACVRVLDTCVCLRVARARLLTLAGFLLRRLACCVNRWQPTRRPAHIRAPSVADGVLEYVRTDAHARLRANAVCDALGFVLFCADLNGAVVVRVPVCVCGRSGSRKTSDRPRCGDYCHESKAPRAVGACVHVAWRRREGQVVDA